MTTFLFFNLLKHSALTGLYDNIPTYSISNIKQILWKQGALINSTKQLVFKQGALVNSNKQLVFKQGDLVNSTKQLQWNITS